MEKCFDSDDENRCRDETIYNVAYLNIPLNGGEYHVYLRF